MHLKRYIATLLLCIAPFGGLSAQEVSLTTFSMRDMEMVIENAIQKEAGVDSIQVNNFRLMSLHSKRSYSGVADPAVRELEYQVDAVKYDASLRRFEVTLVTQTHGASEDEKMLSVTGRYDEMVEVPVLSRVIDRGEVISEDDIDWMEVSQRTLRSGALMDVDDIVNKEARRRLRADSPLSDRDVVSPLFIKKGSAVTVRYTARLMRLKAVGEALEDGRSGEIVRVKNVKSGKIIAAKVISIGEVEVNFTRQLAGNSNIKLKGEI